MELFEHEIVIPSQANSTNITVPEDESWVIVGLKSNDTTSTGRLNQFILDNEFLLRYTGTQAGMFFKYGYVLPGDHLVSFSFTSPRFNIIIQYFKF